MNRMVCSLSLLVALLTLGSASPARAQGAGEQKKPKTPSQSVLENWNDIGGRLVAMAEDWPEDKYGYKLKPETRSFQEVLLHVAGSNYDLLKNIVGSKVGDDRNDPPVAEYKSKAATIAFLKKSIADAAAEIQKQGDTGILKRLDYWIGYTEHMGEHYGLLVAYYRASGVVPPESRPKK
ncbi:MAG TPA: DinB family protein [Candidatus Sulfotelmatobacter sp.]|nr:DinB family protein [Candidatus Sulfotelmatobacter sp.]